MSIIIIILSIEYYYYDVYIAYGSRSARDQLQWSLSAATGIGIVGFNVPLDTI